MWGDSEQVEGGEPKRESLAVGEGCGDRGEDEGGKFIWSRNAKGAEKEGGRA